MLRTYEDELQHAMSTSQDKSHKKNSFILILRRASAFLDDRNITWQTDVHRMLHTTKLAGTDSS